MNLLVEEREPDRGSEGRRGAKGKKIHERRERFFVIEAKQQKIRSMNAHHQNECVRKEKK